jgi:aryl-alcohol dehydrogenase-like predicted oxidoreductase
MLNSNGLVKNMNRKQLGNRHLSVTPIGLGLGALGRPGYINLGYGDDLNDNHDVTAIQAKAETQNTTVDSMALAAVINQPFVGVVLSGAACVDHLKSNLQALKIKWNDSLAEMLDALVASADSYWQIRSQLAWN